MRACRSQLAGGRLPCSRHVVAGKVRSQHQGRAGHLGRQVRQVALQAGRASWPCRERTGQQVCPSQRWRSLFFKLVALELPLAVHPRFPRALPAGEGLGNSQAEVQPARCGAALVAAAGWQRVLAGGCKSVQAPQQKASRGSPPNASASDSQANHHALPAAQRLSRQADHLGHLGGWVGGGRRSSGIRISSSLACGAAVCRCAAGSAG